MNAYERPREPDSAHPSSLAQPAVEPLHDISIGKAVVTRETDGVLAEVFTMTIGEETIQLLPFKNWSQLDSFKWRARGILPGTPAGLEIAWDHLKVAGETASPWDPEACGKLEKKKCRENACYRGDPGTRAGVHFVPHCLRNDMISERYPTTQAGTITI